MSGCKGKSSWPELVGKDGDVAKVVITGENPNVTATKVKEGSSVTTDFRCDRVFVWVDGSDAVTRVPKIG
ncbi:hypothetical protein MLD38_027317 [Melastoma candidum]|uniref:Uncharacterized protein n=1 Tax=Melastoma candidum TaxID=119954 RepID=A0ACB9P1C0_9MYRT|nr:hypothetical protein MLD38_027317 [Melastoma candidum]